MGARCFKRYPTVRPENMHSNPGNTHEREKGLSQVVLTHTHAHQGTRVTTHTYISQK